MARQRRSKDLNEYPQQFWQIVEDCGLGGKALAIPCSGFRQYKSISGLWYNFTGNLKDRRDELQKLGRPLGDEESRIVQAAKFCSRVVLVAEPDQKAPSRLVWMNRENSWMERALAGLEQVAGPLGAEPASAQAPMSAAAFEELLQLQRDMDAGAAGEGETK